MGISKIELRMCHFGNAWTYISGKGRWKFLLYSVRKDLMSLLTSIELNEKIYVANLNLLNFVACCYCMDHIFNKEYKKRLGDFWFPMVVQLSVHGPKLWANHPYIEIICQLSICKNCDHHKYVNWISLLWTLLDCLTNWLMHECFTILMSH